MKKFILIIALLIHLSAFAQVVLVNHVGSTTGTTSAVSGTGANFIAICTDISQPTDSSGNTYTLAYQYDFPGEISTGLWVAFGPTVTSSMTFTTPSPVTSISVLLFSGVASGPDQKNGAAHAQPLSLPSVTPTNNNELLISCYGKGGSNTASVTSSPLTIGNQPFVGYGGWASAYEIQTTATATAQTWTDTTDANASLIATFYSDESPAPLVVTTTNLPEGFVSTAYGSTSSLYSNQLAASGGAPPYAWSCPSTCHLPSTLSLNSGTGVITGTPTASQSATNATFQVTDSASNTASVTLPLTIASTLFSLTAGTCTGSALLATQLAAYSGCALSVAGGTSPHSLSVDTNINYSSLPYGMILNTSTGAITAPSVIGAQGDYEPLLDAQDNLGALSSFSPQFVIAGNNVTSALPWVGSIFSANISSLPVDTSPAAPVKSAVASEHLKLGFGANPGYGPNGIPFLVVPYNQALENTGYYYPLCTNLTACYQSYFTQGPWPWYAPTEDSWNCPAQDCDHHSLIVQNAGGGNPAQLWEMWQGIFGYSTGSGSGATFTPGTPGVPGPWSDFSQFYISNLGSSGTGAYVMPPLAYGSTDAAGLPVAPLLINADEVIGSGTPSAPTGAVLHPTRFTIEQPLTRFVWPATVGTNGFGYCTGGYEDGNNMLLQANPPSSCTNSMPMGEIYRLKSSVPNPSCASTSPQAAIVIQGFRNYGIMVADLGIDGYIIGTPDSRWNDTDLNCLTNLIFSDFEPVDVHSIAVNLPTTPTAIGSYQTTGGGTYYTLMVSTAGSGAGSISGTNCSTNNYLASSTIGACTATPSGGSTFAGWSGTLGCTGTGTCTQTLTATSTMIATFNTSGSTATGVSGATLYGVTIQ